MRENRTNGSEGGVRRLAHSDPYRRMGVQSRRIQWLELIQMPPLRSIE